MNELWTVRHGKTEWSVAGKHTSTTDLPLLPEGESVARGLRDRLDGVEFAQVLTDQSAPAGSAYGGAGGLP